MKRNLLAGLLLAVFSSTIAAADDTIRVVIWDEQQPSQKEAYPGFLGEYIAAYLKKQPGLSVTSVSLSSHSRTSR